MAEASKMPEAGEKAPAFSGTTQDGDRLALESYRGRRLALYFYPEDFTPGCTIQACNLRDGYQDLLEAGIAVLGVSPDASDAHQRFANEYELPFPLIADPDRTIMELYGTWGEKSMYGKKVIGVKRTTFLIDEEGTIVHVIKRPVVKDHAEQILKKFND